MIQEPFKLAGDETHASRTACAARASLTTSTLFSMKTAASDGSSPSALSRQAWRSGSTMPVRTGCTSDSGSSAGTNEVEWTCVGGGQADGHRA